MHGALLYHFPAIHGEVNVQWFNEIGSHSGRNPQLSVLETTPTPYAVLGTISGPTKDAAAKDNHMVQERGEYMDFPN